jgi:hypothetical protein
MFNVATCALGNTDKTDIVIVHVFALLLLLLIEITIGGSGKSIDDSGDIGGRGEDVDWCGLILSRGFLSSGLRR